MPKLPAACTGRAAHGQCFGSARNHCAVRAAGSGMGRLSAIFIAFCMVLIAASVGVVSYLSFGFTGMDAAVVAIAALTALVMVNSITGRARDRAEWGDQIADLSRGTAETGRQVSELDRRIAAIEGECAASLDRTQAATEPLAAEIGELGELVKDLADAVAAHEQMLANASRHADAGSERRGCAGVAPTMPPAAMPQAGQIAAAELVEQTVAAAPPPPDPERAGSGTFKGKTRPRSSRDRPRDRGQSHRPLPAADRHAAAAQGALLRGADAAARRRRRAADPGRFPRATPRPAG